MYERFTDRARQVMSLANQEAQRFNHEVIGSEHIVLGLIKEGSGVAANVLKNVGIDLRKLREQVHHFAGSGQATSGLGKLPMAEGAQRVLRLAVLESHRLRHNYVGTEHLLLAIIRDADGAAAKALTAVGVDLAKLREEVMQLLGTAVDDNTPQQPDGRSGKPDRNSLLKYYRELHAQLIHQRDAAVSQAEYEIAVFHREAAGAIEDLIGRIEAFFKKPGAGGGDAGPG